MVLIKDMRQVKLREATQPPIDALLIPPLEPHVQETRNHYINANYIRGYDARYEVVLFCFSCHLILWHQT